MWVEGGRFYSRRTETTLKNYVIQLIHSKYKRTTVAVSLTRQLESEFELHKRKAKDTMLEVEIFTCRHKIQ